MGKRNSRDNLPLGCGDLAENHSLRNNPDNNNTPSQASRDLSASSEYGYHSDSLASFFEEGVEAMSRYPVRDLPDQEVRRFIGDTNRLIRHRSIASIRGDDDPVNKELRDHWLNRNHELSDELQRRKDQGTIPYSSPESGYRCSSSDTEESKSQPPGDVSNELGNGTATPAAPAADTGTSSGI